MMLFISALFAEKVQKGFHNAHPCVEDKLLNVSWVVKKNQWFQFKLRFKNWFFFFFFLKTQPFISIYIWQGSDFK